MTLPQLVCDHGFLPAGTCRECNPLPRPVGDFCPHCRPAAFLDDEHTWIAVWCSRALEQQRQQVAV